jgi:hypothetical protein
MGKHVSNRLRRIAGWGLAGLILLSPVAAPAQQPAPAPALPSDAELDALAAARNWNALGLALSQPTNPELARAMNWLGTRLDAGGGLMLGIVYARDLWGVGLSQQVDDPAKDMRLTAGVITLYTYQLIVIDGAKCADRTAPGHRIEQLFSGRGATLAFLKKQPPEIKARIVDGALALEKKTAPLRQEDDLICRDGLEQMKAGLERGQQHDVATPPGQIGRTVAVAPPADWVPKFVAPEIYKPLQDNARAGMKASLLTLVE